MPVHSDGTERVLISNGDNSIQVQIIATEWFYKALKGRREAFFETHLFDHDAYMFDREVEAQEWNNVRNSKDVFILSSPSATISRTGP